MSTFPKKSQPLQNKFYLLKFLNPPPRKFLNPTPKFAQPPQKNFQSPPPPMKISQPPPKNFSTSPENFSNSPENISYPQKYVNRYNPPPITSLFLFIITFPKKNLKILEGGGVNLLNPSFNTPLMLLYFKVHILMIKTVSQNITQA